MQILAQKYTEDAMDWEAVWEKERKSHLRDRQEAELQITRVKAEAAAMMERVVAEEREAKEALRVSLQNSLSVANALLESKEKYISELVNERGSYRLLVRSFVLLTKQRVQNMFRALRQTIRPPRRRKTRLYYLFANDGENDTRRILCNGTFLSW